MKVAFITGINGQDGSYLAEFLLKKQYKVHGMIRRASLFNLSRLDNIRNEITLHYGDMSDSSCFISILSGIKNLYLDMERLEVYNLAAQSHVKVSFEIPQYTAMTDGNGVINILEAIRTLDLTKVTRFYQASTSEMYGKVQEVPQKETTPFYPRSPYGCSKVFGHLIAVNYREAYGMFNCCGILFNHESPRRGENFVTRKITISLPKVLNGEMNVLELGNLNAKRDWGHAKDYVIAMWLMLQQESPDDYVVATGEQYSVKDFIEKAYKYLIEKKNREEENCVVKWSDIRWENDGKNEIGIVTFNKQTTIKHDYKSTPTVYNTTFDTVVVRVNEKFFRPTEVDSLLGDPKKIKSIGWKPEISFDDLVKEMITADADTEIKLKI